MLCKVVNYTVVLCGYIFAQYVVPGVRLGRNTQNPKQID